MKRGASCCRTRLPGCQAFREPRARAQRNHAGSKASWLQSSSSAPNRANPPPLPPSEAYNLHHNEAEQQTRLSTKKEPLPAPFLIGATTSIHVSGAWQSNEER